MTTTPEQLRAMRKADPGRFAEYERTKRARHGEKMKAAAKTRKARWISANPEKVQEQYRRQNAKRAAQRSKALAERYRTDPAHNLIVRLRVRTRKALKGATKSAATKELLGCSPDALRLWLELHFASGMSWANMAEWELDHHWPLALFDLADPRQLRVATHYTNLRPLWRADNRRKKHSLTPDMRAAFDAWRATLAA